MSTQTIPFHADIPARYTWNAPSVFQTAEAWEIEQKSIAADLPQLRQLAGRLADGPAVLAGALEAI